MNYRVLITKTLEVPQNLYHGIARTEEEAIEMARSGLIDLDGDVAVISVQGHGVTRVLHTFERARKAG